MPSTIFLCHFPPSRDAMLYSLPHAHACTQTPGPGLLLALSPSANIHQEKQQLPRQGQIALQEWFLKGVSSKLAR